MHITLRLIGEHFGGIAVKISFLWGPKYGVYVAPSVSASVMWCLCNNTHNFTFVILYMNNVILQFYTVPMCLHAVRNFVNHKTWFSRKHVSIFLPRKYDVISQLPDSQRPDIAPVGRLFHCDVTIKSPVKWMRYCDVTIEWRQKEHMESYMSWIRRKANYITAMLRALFARHGLYDVMQSIVDSYCTVKHRYHIMSKIAQKV